MADLSKRQEEPAELKQIQENFRLNMRKERIRQVLWSKRNPIDLASSIYGYNLSMFRRRKKFKIKKCWECGSTYHLKSNCPVHRESLLRIRVTELENKLQKLETCMINLEEQKKKRDRKLKKKRQKMKEKKRKRKIQAMNIAVKIRGLLLKEEETLEGKHALGGAVLLDKAKRGVKERIIKAYKEIYNRDVVIDTAEALCAGDEFFEEYYEEKT